MMMSMMMTVMMMMMMTDSCDCKVEFIVVVFVSGMQLTIA